MGCGWIHKQPDKAPCSSDRSWAVEEHVDFMPEHRVDSLIHPKIVMNGVNKLKEIIQTSKQVLQCPPSAIHAFKLVSHRSQSEAMI